MEILRVNRSLLTLDQIQNIILTGLSGLRVRPSENKSEEVREY